MTDSASRPELGEAELRTFVLAKNEAPNIGKCLEALAALSPPVTVLLDKSGTDDTALIASKYSTAKVVAYDYVNHCRAYKDITTSMAVGAAFCMVLDADMVVTKELFAELEVLAEQPKVEVIRAPVLMHTQGRPLRFGGQYPPKPIVFRVGREYFLPVGHGEELVGGCLVSQTREKLFHDDRKSFGDYLASQYQYSLALTKRAERNALTWRDKLRMTTPVMLLVVPLRSYFLRLGFLSGKPALIYALDRLIAEAVMFRQALAEKLRKMTER